MKANPHTRTTLNSTNSSDKIWDQVRVRDPLGPDYYKGIYQTELEREAQWLRYWAADKVDSVELLTKRQGIKPTTLLELGCGTGAVVLECQRRGFAEAFFAIDYSTEAIEYLAAHSTGIHCSVADITSSDFRLDRYFDVVILSHVLEHLEDPQGLLRSLMDKIRFGCLVIEVPLEDLLASRMKNFFRDRSRNLAGHVQFFTDKTFRRLLSSAGLEVTEYRRYAPIPPREAIDFVCKKDHRSRIQTAIKKAIAHGPGPLRPLWERFYYAHYAVLCCPAQTKLQ